MYLFSGFNCIISVRWIYITFTTMEKKHEEVISNYHSWAQVISDVSHQIHMAQPKHTPVIWPHPQTPAQHLDHPGSLLQITPTHTHTHTTHTHRHQEYLFHDVYKWSLTNVRGSLNWCTLLTCWCSWTQYLIDQHFAQFEEQLKLYSNRKTNSLPLICPWWLPVPHDCVATGAMTHSSSSTFSYLAFPTSVFIQCEGLLMCWQLQMKTCREKALFTGQLYCGCESPLAITRQLLHYPGLIPHIQIVLLFFWTIILPPAVRDQINETFLYCGENVLN